MNKMTVQHRLIHTFHTYSHIKQSKISNLFYCLAAYAATGSRYLFSFLLKNRRFFNKNEKKPFWIFLPVSYTALFLLLFLTACHHKTASKQAKIDREKEKTFQAEQKEIADLKKEKKNKAIVLPQSVPSKKVETVGSMKVETANPKKVETINPRKNELAGLKKAENLYKSKAEMPQIQQPKVEISPKGPLSKNEEKKVSSTGSKSKTPDETVTPKNVNVSPMSAISPINASNAGKMGNCIEFFPNKAAISGNSTACLKEISTFLKTNKNIRLAISANVLPTEKVADAVIVKTERAKTIRNFLIQSGIEASRLTVKLNDAKDAAVITLTPDENEKRKK